MSKLAHVDKKRCQAEWTQYSPFIMGGNVHQSGRCEKPAAFIAKEKSPGPDGQRGSMSVCTECKERLTTQFTKLGKELPGFATIKRKRSENQSRGKAR